MEKQGVWTVTIYFHGMPELMVGGYDYIRRMRENAIIRGIACSGMFEL